MLCATGIRTTYYARCPLSYTRYTMSYTRCAQSYMVPDPNGYLFFTVWIVVLLRLTVTA